MESPSLLVFPALLLLALCLLCIAMIFTSLLSGWQRLAQRFRATTAPRGDVRSVGPWFLSVRMRFRIRYNGCVRLQAAEDGLYLSSSFLCRLAHPSLRIPWNEIRIAQVRPFLFSYFRLTLGAQEEIPLTIPLRPARKLGLPERMAAPAPAPTPATPRYEPLPFE